MKFNTHQLLENLKADVRIMLLQAARLKQLPPETLQMPPSPERWSIAQVLEHLNFYSRFYIHAIEEKLHHNPSTPAQHFKPGWFGNYFTTLMKPSADNQVKTKMKAMKNATPPVQTDGSAALTQFIADQHTLLNLLEIAKSVDLGAIKVPTSITKLITLKLGDTFRFLIAHEQRHMIQIENTWKQIAPALPHSV